MHTLRIQLLGDFSLTYGDEPVIRVRTSRLQSFLAYLLLHRDTPQARQQLAFLFWPDSTDTQARTNLRNVLHRLRDALPDADHYLHIDAQTLQWRPSVPFILDVAEFEQAVAQAEQASDPTSSRAALEAAVMRYHGSLLPGCYDDWIFPVRERLAHTFTQVLAQLVQLLTERHDVPTAIDYAQRLIRHDPLHEATYLHLMHLHAQNGDRASALRVYHTCATALQRELSMEPGPPIREAYDRLLHVETPAAFPEPATGTLATVAPLVGRRQEWQTLQAAWHAAARGQPRFALISGEVGIGKTRLAEELLAWASRQSIHAARTNCYAMEGGLAYTPVVGWLRTPMLRTTLSTLQPIWLRSYWSSTLICPSRLH